MAEKNTLIEQMLEHLVNDEQQKAEELFHEYVVAKSRDIYEGLIESELSEEDKDEDEEDKKDDEVDENFEEFASEEDKTDDLASELDADMGDEMDMGDDEGDDEEKSEEELFQDLDAIVDELQAKFDELKGEESGEEEEMKDDFELETVREYVEKVPAGHGAEKKGAAEKADNTKSAVAGKNDMGGTTANIAKGGEEKGGDHAGLSQTKAKEDNAGNINVPGGKAGSAFSKKEPGHGAEKKGASESADNKQSLFRGRR